MNLEKSIELLRKSNQLPELLANFDLNETIENQSKVDAAYVLLSSCTENEIIENFNPKWNEHLTELYYHANITNQWRICETVALKYIEMLDWTAAHRVRSAYEFHKMIRDDKNFLHTLVPREAQTKNFDKSMKSIEKSLTKKLSRDKKYLANIINKIQEIKVDHAYLYADLDYLKQLESEGHQVSGRRVISATGEAELNALNHPEFLNYISQKFDKEDTQVQKKILSDAIIKVSYTISVLSTESRPDRDESLQSIMSRIVPLYHKMKNINIGKYMQAIPVRDNYGFSLGTLMYASNNYNFFQLYFQHTKSFKVYTDSTSVLKLSEDDIKALLKITSESRPESAVDLFDKKLSYQDYVKSLNIDKVSAANLGKVLALLDNSYKGVEGEIKLEKVILELTQKTNVKSAVMKI